MDRSIWRHSWRRSLMRALLRAKHDPDLEPSAGSGQLAAVFRLKKTIVKLHLLSTRHCFFFGADDFIQYHMARQPLRIIQDNMIFFSILGCNTNACSCGSVRFIHASKFPSTDLYDSFQRLCAERHNHKISRFSQGNASLTPR